MRKLLIIALALLLPLQAFAAISLDTTTSTEVFPAPSSTLVFTVSASATLLTCQVISFGANRTTASTSWNGVDMTKAVQGDGNSVNASVWYLANPASGAHTARVQMPGSADDISWACTSLLGTNTTSPLDTTSTQAFNAAGVTSTITTGVNGEWMFDAIGDQTRVQVAGSNQTQNLNTCSGTCSGSYKTATTAGSNTMNWTFTGGTDNGDTAVAAFNPASSTPAVAPTALVSLSNKGSVQISNKGSVQITKR